MSAPIRRMVVTVAALAVLAFAGYVLVRDIREVGPVALRQAWHSLAVGPVIASCVLTALSFACLALLEWIAARTVPQRPIPIGVALRTGATSHALCNTLGFHAVLAPALRMVSYRREGASAGDVARMLAVVAGGIVFGVAATAGLAAAALTAGGAGMLLAAALIVALLLAWRRLGTPRGQGPFARILQAGPAAAAVGMLEAGFAMSALYVLMPAQAVASPSHFVLAFASAGVLGVVSHAPGGIGVFEAGMLTALPGDRAHVLAALIAYRVIYNLAPAAIAGLTLAAQAWRSHRAVPSSTADNGRLPAAAPDRASPMR